MSAQDAEYVAPVTYQGGKSRLARQIVDHWWPIDAPFYDICCGSGAITLEMLRRGFPADEVTMVEAGPWGLFWQELAEGTFCFDIFESYIEAIPSDPRLIQGYVAELASYPAGQDTAEVFPILQAASFGGKAVWIEGGRWRTHGFRSHWEPTTTSNRRSHVNPMMPMPETILRRVEALLPAMSGVTVCWQDAQEFDPAPGSLVYVDPPYGGTTAYGHAFDLTAFLDRNKKHSLCYVSEGFPINGHAICLSKGRGKGGISGDRATVNEEWLSCAA